jgi:HK97 gp10 family phage protein
MKSSFKVTGMEAYFDLLQKAGKDIDLISRSALKEAGEILQADMISRVPVDTGNLRDHIKIYTPSAEGYFNYVAVGIIRDLGYTDKETAIQANAVEFGSVHTAARPFIRPAVRAKKAAIMKLIRDRLKSAGLID